MVRTLHPRTHRILRFRILNAQNSKVHEFQTRMLIKFILHFLFRGARRSIGYFVIGLIVVYHCA